MNCYNDLEDLNMSPHIICSGASEQRVRTWLHPGESHVCLSSQAVNCFVLKVNFCVGYNDPGGSVSCGSQGYDALLFYSLPFFLMTISILDSLSAGSLRYATIRTEYGDGIQSSIADKWPSRSLLSDGLNQMLTVRTGQVAAENVTGNKHFQLAVVKV